MNMDICIENKSTCYELICKIVKFLWGFKFLDFATGYENAAIKIPKNNILL